MNKQQRTLARCGDSYGYGLWTQDFPYYKNQPPAVGARAFAEWLADEPLCGHKKCAGKRQQRLAEWRKKGGMS